MTINFIIAFNLGLFSTLHCVGMCGGILTAMMFATPEADQSNKFKKIARSLVYNLGRISSYAIAGLLSGLIGLQIAGLFQNINAHIILQSIAAFVLIGLALNILGLVPFRKFTESLGMQIWKRIQPVSRCFYPVNTLIRVFLIGMLWGWLPCGLVYSALILSLSTGAPIDGMLTMMFFGLGTLPGLLTAGYFSSYLNRIKTDRYLRITTAILMILIAISLPASTIYFSQHHDHGASENASHQHHGHHEAAEASSHQHH